MNATAQVLTLHRSTKRLARDSTRVAYWVAERAMGSVSGAVYATGIERDGKIVAGFMIYGWNGSQAMLSVRIDDPRATTRQWWGLMFRYPFIALNAKVLRATTLASNEECLTLAKKTGFREEHRMVDARPEGDVILLMMRRENCRFLDWR